MRRCYFCDSTLEEGANVTEERIIGDDDYVYMTHADCLADDELRTQESKRTYVVTVWHASRADGGPEEGGWSYECGDLEMKVELWSKEAAEAVAEALAIEYPYTGKRNSVLGGEDYEIKVLSRDDAWDLQHQFDARLDLINHYPVVTPRYE